MNRTQFVNRGVEAFACGVLLALSSIGLTSCARVDATADYSRASQVIKEQTGVDALFDPAADDEASDQVDELLRNGLTVEEAVRVALLNNREFQSLFAEIGASRADVVQSTLLSNPTLSLGFLLPEGGGLTDFTLGFAQQIADVWMIPVRKQIAEIDLERTIHQAGQRAVELSTEVRTRFYRVIALRQALQYTGQNIELAERTIELAEAQYKAGEVSEFDVNLIRGGSVDLREELITARGQFEQALLDLAQSLGLSEFAGALELVGDLPEPSFLPDDLDALLDQAIDERFDVRIAYANAERAEAALRLELRRWLPDVQLGFGFERSERRALPGRKILADTARASIASGRLSAPSIQSRGERAIDKSQIIDAKLGPTLALTLPIFDQNQAQIAKARVRTLQARKDYEAKVEVVMADLQRAWSAAHSAADLVEFQQSVGLPLAEQTVKGASDRYRAGEAGVLVLIEAQDSLVKRRRGYVNALRDYAVAMAQLQSVVGGRLPGAPPPTSMPATTPTEDEQ